MHKDGCNCDENTSTKKSNVLEQNIYKLQKSFFEFKCEFAFKYVNFQTKISIYADVFESNKPTEFITDINSKLNVVAEKIETEKEQKLMQAKALNIILL